MKELNAMTDAEVLSEIAQLNEQFTPADNEALLRELAERPSPYLTSDPFRRPLRMLLNAMRAVQAAKP